MSHIPPPTPLSLLAADNHIIDARTGMHSLIGVLSHVNVKRFPVTLPRLCIFAEMTNGRGIVPITIRIVDADEARPAVWAVDLEVDFADPLAVTQVVCGTAGLVFPEQGDYRIQLLAGTTVLLERRLVFMQAAASEPTSE